MTRPAVTLWLVLAFHFFVRDALALCSNWSSTETCVADTSCEWRWNTRSCTSSCRVLYSSIADCVDDDACEWNAALQTCRQRCSWQTTEAVCFQPTCEWATIVGTPFSKCMSNCARYGAVSGDCSTDSNCMWNSTRCVDNPNATTTANSTYIMTIVNSDLVRILANNTAAISSFALALQDDLLTLTNRSGLILVDSSGFTVTMNDNVVTVEFLCQFTEPPSLIRTESSMGGTWLTATTRLFTALGGTSPLSVQSLQGVASVTTLAPQGFRPGATLNPDPGTSHLVVTPASSEPPLSPIQIILIVVGTLVLVVAGVGVSVWVWRRNPYAASRGPVRVERFGPEEYDRLRAANDHVVTYEQAMELKQKWDSLHGGLESVSEMSRWPVVARCDMPRKELRSAEMRGVADALTSVLFPVVFEHLTHIRIAMDENDAIRINTQNVDPIDVVRYNGAFRLQMNRNSASVVLLGASRLIVVSMNDDGSCRPYDSVQVLRPDAPDSCNVVKDLFETSNCCSHVGIIDQRKIVMARLIAADPFVVPTSSAPGNVDSAVTLLGVPESWTSGVVETAVKVMVRAGSLHLIDGASKSIAQCQVRVQRGNDAGEWRVRVHPPQALSILIAVSSRFWCLDDDILCCQCTSGISILPAQGTDRAAIEDESQATTVAIEMTRIG